MDIYNIVKTQEVASKVAISILAGLNRVMYAYAFKFDEEDVTVFLETCDKKESTRYEVIVNYIDLQRALNA